MLLTNLAREVIIDEPLRFPHMLSDIKAFIPGGQKHILATFGSYIVFDESGVAGYEIGTALNIFGDYILNELLPLFEKFF